MSSLETISTRENARVLAESPKILVTNPAFGVNVYKNTVSSETSYKYIDVLNTELDGTGAHSWLTPEPGRNANYFLTSEKLLPISDKENKVLRALHKSVFDVVKTCIDDYAKSWKISINHYDPLNFVKYTHPHNNFDLHIDDNPDSPRTVSAVMYLNDNYDGGELRFSRLDNFTIKPEIGDLAVFPSSYLYEHESKPVTRGTKYSVAIFTHYKERE